MDALDQILDVLCPMYVRLDDSGHISHAGPTLAKLSPVTLVGQRFLEVFELKRPRAVASMEELRSLAGMKLHLRMRDAAKTSLKGVVVSPPDGTGAIVNLSFGISVVDAVKLYKLTSADFAATDLAIEMLYLMEAKSAAMAASRTLNQRLQGAKIAAEEQAFTDTLTGLKNRRALDHILDRLVKHGAEFTLMHLDLDFFKSVNDTLGHAAGDHVLQEVARVLVEGTRDQDTIARVGGDEFILVFHNTLPDARMAAIADTLIGRIEKPIPFGDDVAKISASIGLVQSVNYDPMDLARLHEDADLALYASKHAGRGCYTIYTPELREQGVLQGMNAAE